MTCNEIQDKILRFIDNEIKEKELEEFLKHINDCQQCREELEIYYSLLNGCKQLETNLEVPEEFHQTLMEKIKTTEKSIHKKKKIIAIKRYLTTAVAIFVCVVSLKVYTDINNKTKNDSFTKSESAEDSTDLTVTYSLSDSQEILTREGVYEFSNENVSSDKGLDGDVSQKPTSDVTVTTKKSNEIIGVIGSEEKPEVGITASPAAENQVGGIKDEVNIQKYNSENVDQSKNNIGVYIGIAMILLSFVLAVVFFNKFRH